MKDWETKILSSHKTSLARQTKKAFLISREEVENLLNSKNEYGANNISELIIKHGNEIVGEKRREKRKRIPEQDRDETQETERQSPTQTDHGENVRTDKPTCQNETTPGEVLESTQEGGKRGQISTKHVLTDAPRTDEY